MCASIAAAHCSSPLTTMHSSRAFLVSGQAQQILSAGFGTSVATAPAATAGATAAAAVLAISTDIWHSEANTILDRREREIQRGVKWRVLVGVCKGREGACRRCGCLSQALVVVMVVMVLREASEGKKSVRVVMTRAMEAAAFEEENSAAPRAPRKSSIKQASKCTGS